MDRIIVDDLYQTIYGPAHVPPRWAREMSAKQVLDYQNEKRRSRFGVLIKDMGALGELRKQKKAPRTQVLYVWTKTTERTGQVFRLRSINNCSIEQLTIAIQNAGEIAEQAQNRADAEFVLDLLYAELGRRVG